MQIKDIMTKNVITAEPETKIDEIAKTLTENRIHGMPVVKGGKVVGIVVENDFFIKSSVNIYLPSYIDFLKKTPISGEVSKDQQEKMSKLLNTRAKDIMTFPCLSVNPSMDVREALKIFKETQLITFPVVDERENLVGIVTLSDVLNLF